MKKIIALVGMPGAGKSSAAEILKKVGLKGIYFGNLTLDYLKKNQQTITLQKEKEAREFLRRKYGMNAYAQLALPEIKKLLVDNELIYIDGLYSLEEYEYLLNELVDEIILLEIYVDKKTRHERLTQRKTRSLTKKECFTRDMTEIKTLNKGGPIALSDYKIENQLGISELEKKILTLLKSLRKNK